MDQSETVKNFKLPLTLSGERIEIEIDLPERIQMDLVQGQPSDHLHHVDHQQGDEDAEHDHGGDDEFVHFEGPSNHKILGLRWFDVVVGSHLLRFWFENDEDDFPDGVQRYN